MKSYDIFNLQRFGKYFGSDLKNCTANYGLSMSLISMMGVIIYLGTVIMGLLFTGEWGGPERSFRAFTFAISFFVLMTTMPVKCYGMITEKKAGTSWLMIPASTFEKVISMVIMTVFIAPLSFCIVFLGTDLILCSLDSTCGSALIPSFKNLLDIFISESVATDADIQQFPALADFIRQIGNPWLYLDDLISISLVFLAGAVFFKTGKTAKTILSIIAISFALGIVMTPVMKAIFNDMNFVIDSTQSPESLDAMFKMGIFRHAALIDTINDTIVNLALLACIFFRVKTLKH